MKNSPKRKEEEEEGKKNTMKPQQPPPSPSGGSNTHFAERVSRTQTHLVEWWSSSNGNPGTASGNAGRPSWHPRSRRAWRRGAAHIAPSGAARDQGCFRSESSSTCTTHSAGTRTCARKGLLGIGISDVIIFNSLCNSR